MSGIGPHGDSDPLIPVAGGRTPRKAFPGAELVVVPGMSHGFPEPVLVPLCLKHIADFVVKAEGRAN